MTCNEEQDYHKKDGVKRSDVFLKEFTNYTPLMLCVARDDANLDCVKTLLTAKADFTTLDIFNNSVLHIAAINGNNKILEYLAKNLKIDIFARNKDGETALTLC